LSGKEDVAMVAAFREGPEQTVMPLRLRPCGEKTFRDFQHDAHQNVIRAKEHSLYAFYVLNNPLCLAEYGCDVPSFDVGYIFDALPELTSAGQSLEAFQSYPGVAEGLHLILHVTAKPEERGLQLIYEENALGSQMARKLALCVATIIEKVMDDPDVCLSDIPAYGDEDYASRVVRSHAESSFNF